MATISSLKLPLPTPTKLPLLPNPSIPTFQFFKPITPFNHFPKLTHSHGVPSRLFAVAEEAAAAVTDPSSEAARRLYVGNIPRTLSNEELQKIVAEHGAVEKAEVFHEF